VSFTERKIDWNLKPPPALVRANNSSAEGIDFREFNIEGIGSFDWYCSVLQVVVVLESNLKVRPQGRPDFEEARPNGVASVYLPGEPVRGEWEGTGSFLGTYLSPDFVERIFERPFRTMKFAGGMHESSVIENLLHAIRADVVQGSPGGPLFIQSVVISLLHYLNRSADESPLLVKGGLSRRQLNIFQDMVYTSLADQLSIEQLSRGLGVSSGYLGRAFKRSTGLSPHQYVLRTRVDRAKQLIQTTNRSLDEIAEQVGFADGSHMSTVFLKLTGKPPSHFRNR
jgi:AraC family transcriptional regulator